MWQYIVKVDTSHKFERNVLLIGDFKSFRKLHDDQRRLKWFCSLHLPYNPIINIYRISNVKQNKTS